MKEYRAKKHIPRKNDAPRDIPEEIELGKRDEDVYTEEGREKLVEDDELSPIEAGFMEGEESIGEFGECAKCGKPLGNQEEVVELKIKKKRYLFCSSKCAEDFKKK